MGLNEHFENRAKTLNKNHQGKFLLVYKVMERKIEEIVNEKPADALVKMTQDIFYSHAPVGIKVPYVFGEISENPEIMEQSEYVVKPFDELFKHEQTNPIKNMLGKRPDEKDL